MTSFDRQATRLDALEGRYDGGRMLFLGFGTGLGSALIADHVILPLELGDLPFRHATFSDKLGREALEAKGKKAWRRLVLRTLLTDYEGNPLPEEVRVLFRTGL